MIQLKIRTEYSFGRAYAPIDRIIERLTELGTTHAGIVDTNTWGHVEWDAKCRAAGIVPMFGVELVVNDGEDDPTKMWFLARSTEGLSALYRMSSLAQRQPMRTPYGSVPRLYRSDVLSVAPWHMHVFAGDVMDGAFLKQAGAHIDLTPSSRIATMRKCNIAREHELFAVNVCDNNVAFESDLEMLPLCSKFAQRTTESWITEHALVWDPQTARDCESVQLPTAPPLHEDGDLYEMCVVGVLRRGIDRNVGLVQDKYAARMKRELEVIQSKGFESYFIIVADMVEYAKKHMLVGPSRGSAAGSLVCYLLGITEIDPVRTGLMFERFIDESRDDLPDIDLDFPADKRHLVFTYMSGKYGAGCVGNIGTIGRYRGRNSLDQACRALNVPLHATGAVKANLIERAAGHPDYTRCLADTFRQTPAGQAFLRSYPQAELAGRLEGHAKQTGTHAAGLLVCNEKLENFATVQADGVVQIDKYGAERLGLLKIDVLGLRMLEVLADSGVDLDWYNLPDNDPGAFAVLNRRSFCGIFQFEGRAMRGVANRMQFANMNDIDAATALARPGPMSSGVTESYLARAGGSHYEKTHELVEQVLAASMGLPVYQEQTMALCRDVGGFSWADTSAVRRKVSKTQGAEALAPYWAAFLTGALGNGLTEEQTITVWAKIVAMGAYQMNRAHTYSYATVSYWCAYLKAHHPLAFAAATLRHAKDEESAVELLRELSREGVKFTPFDATKSLADWSVQDGVLVGGFRALKGVGEKKAEKFMAARNGAGLTDKNLEFLSKCANPFSNVFPIHKAHQAIYDSPAEFGVGSELREIDTLVSVPHCEERVFIGELTFKRDRDANEPAQIEKRDGKRATGQTYFIDVRFRDDSGSIGGRVGVKDRPDDFNAAVNVGNHVLIRAAFYNEFNYAFVKRWRVLA